MHSLTAVWLCAALSVVAVPALGQPAGPSPAERLAARGLADEGLELFKAERYAEAFERFAKAEGIVHAPPHILFMARAKDKLGALIAARELYGKLLGEELAADAPKQFHDALAAGKAERDALDGRIPDVTVSVTRGASAGLALTIDGIAASFDKAVPLDPGDHTLAVKGPGYPGERRTLHLTDGKHERVSIVGIGPVSGPEPDPEPSSQGGLAGSLLGPAALFGLGAIGLGVGIGTGVAALNKAGELKDLCPENPCSPENEPLASSARALGVASTVSFVLGGLSLAGGAVWMIVAPPGAGSEASSSGTRARGPWIAVELAPEGLHLGGAF